MTIIVASAPSWTDIVTAIGTVLAGLALPLAFIQLGALRQDRLRAQVSKAGAWTGMPEQTGEEPGLWTIPVLIRNGSELPPPEPAFETGVGEPGWKGLFHQALNDLRDRRIWIGTPSTDVFAEGPGVVQYFDSNLSLFGWVLCALPHQRPVAVAGEVWQALQAAGAGALGEDPLAAVGFPTPSPQATQVVDADATRIRLLSPGTRDCVELAQRKAGQLADQPRRRRAARISAAATGQRLRTLTASILSIGFAASRSWRTAQGTRWLISREKRCWYSAISGVILKDLGC